MIKKQFINNRDLQGKAKAKAIEQGEAFERDLILFMHLKKYRAMKNRYSK